MEDLEIFDKDGKALHIADVISRFIVDKAEQYKVGVNEVMISTYGGKMIIDKLTTDSTHNWFDELEEVDLNGL